MDQEPWFKPKRSGLGLTPITWQGGLVTILIMVVLLGTVALIVRLVHDPLTAIITILIATVVELTVSIPYTYRRAQRTRE